MKIIKNSSTHTMGDLDRKLYEYFGDQLYLTWDGINLTYNYTNVLSAVIEVAKIKNALPIGRAFCINLKLKTPNPQRLYLFPDATPITLSASRRRAATADLRHCIKRYVAGQIRRTTPAKGPSTPKSSGDTETKIALFAFLPSRPE